jgi:hypothetical protein
MDATTDDALDLPTQVGYEGEMTESEAIQLVRTRLGDGSIQKYILENFKPTFYPCLIKDSFVSATANGGPTSNTLKLATNLVRAHKRKAAVEWVCADAAQHIDAARSAEHEIKTSVVSSEEGARIKRRAYDEWTAAEQALDCLHKWNYSNFIRDPDAVVAVVMQELDDARQGRRRIAFDELADAICMGTSEIASAIESAVPQ